MFYTIAPQLILYQHLSIKPSRYSNYELKLHNYFYNKTQIDPSYIINIKIEDEHFIFFFINKHCYFQAKDHLNLIRNEIKHRKVLIIRVDKILINFVFNLFADLCIDDVKIEINHIKGKYEITVCLLRNLNNYHIAVGKKGCYIKAINKLFNDYIEPFNGKTPVIIRCKATGDNSFNIR